MTGDEVVELSDAATTSNLNGPRPSLRFACHIKPGESIPGLLARGVRKHVMEHSSIALDGAGIRSHAPGDIQMLTAGEAVRLADLLRTAAKTLHSVRGTLGRGRVQVFGDLMLPANTLEQRKRRISPLSLALKPYHRSNWLNRFLPYCPESGELLVDTCEHCGHQLGWRSTWGIEVCEACEEKIIPSDEACLPANLNDDYSGFCELWALESGRRDRAREALPPALREADLSAMLPLSLRLAALFETGDTYKSTVDSIKKMPEPAIAKVVTSSFAIIRQWPEGPREQLEKMVDLLGDDHDDFITLWNWLKRLSSVKGSGLGQSNLMISVLPQLRGSVWHSFKQDTRSYTSQEALIKLSTKSPRLRRLATEGIVPTRTLPSRSRKNRQYDADAIDTIEAQVRDHLTFAAASQKLGIPVYGVEQSVQLGAAQVLDSPAMTVLYDDLQLSSDGISNLIERILSKRIIGTRSEKTVSLKNCALAFAGGEKPWGAILNGLRSGAIPFWGCAKGYSLNDIYVERNALSDLITNQPEEHLRSITTQAWVTKEDAEDLLSTSLKGLQSAVESGRLNFERRGMGYAADKLEVLKLARTIASIKELVHVLQTHPGKLSTHRSLAGMKKIGFGYCRSTLIKRGVLPSLPDIESDARECQF